MTLALRRLGLSTRRLISTANSAATALDTSFTSERPLTRALFESHGFLGTNTFRQRIPWGDLDPYGHVNNARYLRYLETGRFHFLDQLEASIAGEGLSFGTDFSGPTGVAPVLKLTQVDFRAQLARDDVVATGYRIEKVGNTSFTLAGMIVREYNDHAPAKEEATAIACTSTEVLVMYDFPNKRKSPLPVAWRRAFEKRLALEQQLSMTKRMSS
ncbi:hypothetical protein PYCC9005_003085 [Savitreella phatthalungensis]